MEKIVMGIVSKYDYSFRAKDIEWNIKMAGADIIVDYVHNINAEGLTVIYNRILKRHPDCHRFCFIHDDVIIDTVGWARKINSIFDRYSEYGIIGVAGSESLFSEVAVKNTDKKEGDELPEHVIIPDGRWWTDGAACHGKVIHSLVPREGVRQTFMTRFADEMAEIAEVSVIDGLIIFVDDRRIAKHFDERFGGFHMYDITFCLANFREDNCKIGVTTDILVRHRSAGNSNSKEYIDTRDKMLQLYADKLPIKHLVIEKEINAQDN